MALSRSIYANFAAFPGSGVANVIYVDASNDNQFLWNGTTYVSYAPEPIGVLLGRFPDGWFTANPTFVLGNGQIVYLSDGEDLLIDAYKIGDGKTELQNLNWKGVRGLAIDGSNANQDIDIGNNKINAQSFHVKGTAGNGHLGLKHQNAPITAGGGESSLGADNSGYPVWKNDGNAIQEILLKDSVNTAPNYTTPLDSDKIGIWDVANSLFKSLTWSNLKGTLKTYFDTVYTTTSAVASQITSALSGYVNTGGLTTNYIPKASDSDTLGNSQIFDNGTNVGIGTSTPTSKLSVVDGVSTAQFGGTYPSIYKDATNYIQFNQSNLGITQLTASNTISLTYGGLSNGLHISQTNYSVGNLVSYNFSDYLFRSFLDNNTNKFIINHFGFSGNNKLGVGVDPTATIHAKGSDSTSSNNCALFVNSSNAEILNLRNDRAIIIESLTANRVLELDANKVVISVAKNSGYNLALGTTAGTVAAGNDTRITQAVRTIYKDFTASAALTGTTSITLINSALIPANTVTVGNEVEIYARAQRNTNIGNSTPYLYVNSSASLSGATLLATGLSTANGFHPIARRLYIKASNDSEVINTTVAQNSDLGAQGATSVSSLNINWTSNVFIIQAHQNAANGDSTTSRGMIIKLS